MLIGGFVNKSLNKNLSLALLIALYFTTLNVFAIEEASSDTAKSKTFFSFFKREKDEVKLEKEKKQKRVEVAEIELPEIVSFKKVRNYVKCKSLSHRTNIHNNTVCFRFYI